MASRCVPTAWRAAAVALIAIEVTSGCGLEREPPAGATAAVPDAASAERTIGCTDGTRTWRATVTEDRAPARVRVRALHPAAGTDGGAQWSLVTTPPGTEQRRARALSADALVAGGPGVGLDVADAPRLLSPDRRCTIYLVPAAPPGTTSFVVVGDSLAAGMVATEPAHAQLRSDAAARGLALLVDGQSGAPWSGLTVEGENLDDELRGALSVERTGVVATVIGANDAILAALAPTQSRQAQRDRTDAAVRTAVDLVRRQGRCLVVTTPPDVPIENFSLGETYAEESRRVGDVLRAFGAADPGVVVVDFAAVSRPHHLPDGAAADWFGDDDQLHPNPAGAAALAALLLDAADRCPTVS